jgi:hypothetical protein
MLRCGAVTNIKWALFLSAGIVAMYVFYLTNARLSITAVRATRVRTTPTLGTPTSKQYFRRQTRQSIRITAKNLTHYPGIDSYGLDGKIELFVDSAMIARNQGAFFRTNSEAVAANVAFMPRKYPWEYSEDVTLVFSVVLFDERDGAYLLYYRCSCCKHGDKYKMDRKYHAYEGSSNLCLARSTDGGISFHHAIIKNGKFPWGKDNEDTNIVLGSVEAFIPYLDNRPNVPYGERFKAFGRNTYTNYDLYSSANGVDWLLLEKRVFDPRQVLIKKLSYAYAYDSVAAIVWDQERFAVFTRGTKDWRHRSIMAGTTQGSDKTSWLNWKSSNSTQASADFRIIDIQPPFLPGESLYTGYPQRGLGDRDGRSLHMWVMPVTRFHSGPLFPGCPFGNDKAKESEFNLTGRPYCELGVTDVQFMFSRDSPEKASVEGRGMRWTRPSYASVAHLNGGNIIEESSKEVNSNDALGALRHFELRKTWAIGGIFPTADGRHSQFYILHNLWDPTLHVRRYVVPKNRFGSIVCASPSSPKGVQKECVVRTKPFHLFLRGTTTKNLILNVRSSNAFGSVHVGILDGLCYKSSKFFHTDACRSDQFGNEMTDKLSKDIFASFRLNLCERILADSTHYNVRWGEPSPPSWWDGHVEGEGRHSKVVKEMLTAAAKHKKYGLSHLISSLSAIFPNRKSYPVQFEFKIKDSEIFAFFIEEGAEAM